MITEIKTCLVLKCTLCNLLNYLSTISSYNHKISLISVQIDKTCVYTGKSKRLHLVKGHYSYLLFIKLNFDSFMCLNPIS